MTSSEELGFTAEDFDDLELLGSADPIDLSVLTDDGDITHAKALRIGTFARFLHLRGDFRKHRTLPLMARYNAKTKSLRRDDNSDDDTKGMLKPSSVPVIPAFSNVAEDFEDYWAAVEGRLRQSHLGEYLDAAPSKNARGRARNENKSLHWVLYEAFRDTDVEHITQEAAKKHKESGHHSHKLILNYYRSDDRIAEVQRRLRNKISALRFDGSDSSVASIQAYTNDFKMLYARLKLAKEVWKDAKLKQEYLRNIQLAGDHPLMVIKTICSSDDKSTFKKTIERLLRTDGQDSLEQNEQQNARARRVNDSSTQGSNTVPNIPDHVVECARNCATSRQAVGVILKWKKIKNEEGRDIRPEELRTDGDSNKQGSSHGKRDEANVGKRGKDRKKGGKRQRRLSISSDSPAKSRRTVKTRKTEAGTSASTAVVSIKDADDPDHAWTDSSSDNDPDTEEANGNNDDQKNGSSKSRKTTKKARRKRKRRLRVRRNRKASLATTEFEPERIIWDTGTDFEVIGEGWHIHRRWKGRTVSLDGALNGMDSSENLPLVAGVTACDTQNGTKLIGIGVAAYDSTPGQVESLVNPNAITGDIDERSKTRGGRQSLLAGDSEVPIKLEANRLPFTYNRMPTEQELQSISITWIVPCNQNILQTASTRIAAARTMKLHVSDDDADNFVFHPEQLPAVRRNDILSKGDLKPLSARLANCPDAIAERTLQATTQLRESTLDMDEREIPRMNRKKRGVPFSQRRLEGRTDSDTFFSSIKSIRGYRCIQVFVHLWTQFLCVTLLRRERDNHGAYQDFIRDVGTPNILLTDNAKSQVGKKWTETSRKNQTQQRQSAPDKQNQNQSERKVGDLKRRVGYTLFASQAPLVFWCYCMQFVVYCLNLTARRRLNWKTSVEALTGNTPDISHLRFAFWDKAWYYEYNAKFPENPWKPCRVVGFADHQGDQFTYKIWTVDLATEAWEKGRELTRDIVIPRTSGEPPSTTMQSPLTDYQALQFETVPDRVKRKTTKSVGKRHRKRAAERASTGPKPAKRKQSGWNAKINDDLTLCTADLTEDEDDFDNNADPTSHLIRQLPQDRTDDTDTIPVSITTGGEEEDAESILNDPLGEFDYDDPTKAEEIYNEFDPDNAGLNQGMQSIAAHRWKGGQLQFQVLWDTDEHTWESFIDLKEDHPRSTAEYMVRNNVTRKKSRDPDLKWAKHTVRDVRRAIRRTLRLYDFSLDEGDRIFRVRRKVRGSKKKKRIDHSKKKYKYGLEEPRNAKRALEVDEENGNHLWRDSMALEIDSLIEYDSFEFRPKGSSPPDSDYQATTLHCVFAIKHDLRRKSRLVAGGHLIDVPTDVQIYSSVVKPISVKLISVIADKVGLKQLCGDVSSAYVNAETSHKVYVRAAGPEFGEREGQMILIKKALYGLSASGADWHRHFSATLRSFGFEPTRFDKDVWIRLAKDCDHYEYICTHVDDFMIASKQPELVMELIKKEYQIKGEGPPDYYLGNDYKTYNGRLAVGCKKYIKEAVRRVEASEGTPIKRQSTPLSPGDHPELDTSEFLDDNGHQHYQMLIGMLNWTVGIGRFDIAHATSSLARFSSCPRKAHLERALRTFGYLKKFPNKRIVVDSRDPIITGGDLSDYHKMLESFKEEYPDAVEEIDANLPTPLVDELAVTMFVDSDHAHDKVTRRSITGLIVLVGRTPVFYYSKRQGAVETSTYSAEFMAMRHAVEEVASLRYMLRCLGVRVDSASHVHGDNLGVIQNATIKDSLLKKKHVAISYHKVREAVAAAIIIPIKIASSDNYADCLTKSLPISDHSRLVNGLFYG